MMRPTIMPSAAVVDTGPLLAAADRADPRRADPRHADAAVALLGRTDLRLSERYADWPLGGVDASVVALAERLGTGVVLTFDERHFRAVAPRHTGTLTLLP